MSQSIRRFGSADPLAFANALEGLAIVKTVTFESETMTLGTVPANSIIGTAFVVRDIAWDDITAFEIGKDGATDWLVSTVQANVNGALDAGEAGNVEAIAVNKFVAEATDVVLTLDQGAATAGAGYVMVTFKELVRRQ